MAQDTSIDSAHLANQTQQRPLQPPQASVNIQATFSIATPIVTKPSPISDSLSDISFMQPAMLYEQKSQSLDGESNLEADEALPVKPVDNNQDEGTDSGTKGKIIQRVDSPSNGPADGLMNLKTDGEQTTVQEQPKTSQNHSTEDDDEEDLTQPIHQDDGSKQAQKKRNKTIKKSTKLDAKSKLEKSRQSARECRARKKLRYQYLEDLVCNREKAVIKLRDELTMFCDLARKLDSGTLTDKERQVLIDQTKENNTSKT